VSAPSPIRVNNPFMAAAASQRLLLVAASAACFALVSAAHILFEQPGLGIGHLFYLPIALAALATDYRIGAAAGLVAGGLWVTGVLLSPDMQSHHLLTAATLIRLFAYISTGGLIGWFARSNRELVGRMRDLAETDTLTALPNMRRFEAELARHCRDVAGFALLVGDLDALKQTNDRDGHSAGNALLRRTAAALHELTRDHNLTARIGGDEFAVLARVASDEEAQALGRELEAELERRRIKISFGWAVFPFDGRSPAELLHRADERLYRSKAERKSRETVVALLTGAIVPAA
jgi:diguanylate cyclase (GGDEF)-like protein